MRKNLLTVMSIVALAALVACGGSSNSTPVPTTPSGGNNAGFSNASLTGNYVFSANGVTQKTSFAVVGVFTANGNGIITAGTRDTVNDAGSRTFNESIVGGYSVNPDGRGQLVLNGSSGQTIYRFVLQSSAAGKLFQVSNTADATGRIQLQSALSTALSGTYVVRLDGEDTARFAYGAIGGLTASGGNLSGEIDENDSGIVNLQLAATGIYTLTSTGRGTATYITPASTVSTAPNVQGTHNFVVYYVSPSRLELLSADQFFLHGYADLQTSIASTPAAFLGNQVFNISGVSVNGTILEDGRFTMDGAGNITNAIEDYNEAGSFFSAVPFTGTYSVASNGRWIANLTYTSSTLGLVGWQVSPQQSILLTTSPTILETGTMRAQTLGLTTASVTGNYAENLDGINVSLGNVETTGNLLANGAGSLSGTVDSQTDSGGVSTDVATTGTYSVDPTLGRSTGFIGAVPVVLYTVDPGTIYTISSDQNRLYQGMMVKQQ